jgi:hypothetical protein
MPPPVRGVGSDEQGRLYHCLNPSLFSIATQFKSSGNCPAPGPQSASVSSKVAPLVQAHCFAVPSHSSPIHHRSLLRGYLRKSIRAASLQASCGSARTASASSALQASAAFDCVVVSASSARGLIQPSPSLAIHPASQVGAGTVGSSVG